ncbi:hypothetical protein [Paraburkholderia sediminicola]|uniref:hypothetical protein n=1 Tax=Paraburkholderia sediminicola TaxID=458836 RepID=UPI0011814470
MLETDEHVIVDSGGEKCISAGNIWRVNRLDRGHDPVMVPADSIRQSSAMKGHSPAPSPGRSDVSCTRQTDIDLRMLGVALTAIPAGHVLATQGIPR